MRRSKVIIATATAFMVLTLAGPAVAASAGDRSADTTIPPARSLRATQVLAAQSPSTTVSTTPTRELSAEVADALTARLRQLIERILQARHARFERASDRIADSIQRAGTLADRVAAKGGDVTDAEAVLGQAEDDLAQAASLEAQAVEQFKAVPGSDDKRAAFLAASETARQAAAELRSAQANVRQAVRLLREQIRLLETAGGAG